VPFIYSTPFRRFDPIPCAECRQLFEPKAVNAKTCQKAECQEALRLKYNAARLRRKRLFEAKAKAAACC